MFALSVAAPTGAGGCARSHRPAGGVAGEPGDGATLSVLAPPRDLTPAVHYAAARRDMAIDHIETRADGTRVFHLVTLRNEEVIVEARSPAWPADDRTPATITLEARVGRFGDADRERALVRQIVARLHELRD